MLELYLKNKTSKKIEKYEIEMNKGELQDFVEKLEAVQKVRENTSSGAKQRVGPEELLVFVKIWKIQTYFYGT